MEAEDATKPAPYNKDDSSFGGFFAVVFHCFCNVGNFFRRMWKWNIPENHADIETFSTISGATLHSNFTITALDESYGGNNNIDSLSDRRLNNNEKVSRYLKVLQIENTSREANSNNKSSEESRNSTKDDNEDEEEMNVAKTTREETRKGSKLSEFNDDCDSNTKGFKPRKIGDGFGKIPKSNSAESVINHNVNILKRTIAIDSQCDTNYIVSNDIVVHATICDVPASKRRLTDSKHDDSIRDAALTNKQINNSPKSLIGTTKIDINTHNRDTPKCATIPKEKTYKNIFTEDNDQKLHTFNEHIKSPNLNTEFTTAIEINFSGKHTSDTARVTTERKMKSVTKFRNKLSVMRSCLGSMDDNEDEQPDWKAVSSDNTRETDAQEPQNIDNRREDDLYYLQATNKLPETSPKEKYVQPNISHTLKPLPVNTRKSLKTKISRTGVTTSRKSTRPENRRVTFDIDEAKEGSGETLRRVGAEYLEMDKELQEAGDASEKIKPPKSYKLEPDIIVHNELCTLSLNLTLSREFITVGIASEMDKRTISVAKDMTEIRFYELLMEFCADPENKMLMNQVDRKLLGYLETFSCLREDKLLVDVLKLFRQALIQFSQAHPNAVAMESQLRELRRVANSQKELNKVNDGISPIIDYQDVQSDAKANCNTNVALARTKSDKHAHKQVVCKTFSEKGTCTSVEEAFLYYITPSANLTRYLPRDPAKYVKKNEKCIQVDAENEQPTENESWEDPYSIAFQQENFDIGTYRMDDCVAVGKAKKGAKPEEKQKVKTRGIPNKHLEHNNIYSDLDVSLQDIALEEATAFGEAVVDDYSPSVVKEEKIEYKEESVVADMRHKEAVPMKVFHGRKKTSPPSSGKKNKRNRRRSSNDATSRKLDFRL